MPMRQPNSAGIISLSSIKVIKNEKPVKKQAAVAANPNTFKLALPPVAEVREQASMPTTPNAAAIGKVSDSCSFSTITANKIRLKDCTNATTGETNETEPIANAW